MKRSCILVGGIHHESNTFNPIISTEVDFSVHYGAEIFAAQNDEDSISGIVSSLRTQEFNVVPIVMARAVPNGVIASEFYLSVKDSFLTEASKVRDDFEVLGIALSLHGSMRVEGIEDAEGDFLVALRRLFPNIPVVAALDMHATITDTMVQCTDALVGYKQAPHTDCFQTGVHAANILGATVRGEVSPVMGWCRLPLIIAGEKTETSVEPMKSLIDLLREKEREQNVLAASFLLGFPWADCPENGVSALVVTNRSAETASGISEELANAFWFEREKFQFHTETYSPHEALEVAVKAVEDGGTPVYLSDSGDNPTAGSSGDSTSFLEQVLNFKALREKSIATLYAGIYDPKAVQRCIQHGVGATLDITVGAAFDQKTSNPMEIEVKVLSIVREWEKYKTDLILLRVGPVDLIIVSKHIGYLSPKMFEALGRKVTDYSLIVVKLGYLTEGHKACAGRTIMALTPGSSNEVLESLPYKNLSRPLYPLDRDISYFSRAQTFFRTVL